MSGVLVGANPAELDALAETFARSGAALGLIHTDVVRLVRQSQWEGRDAEQFDASWTQRARSAFDSANDLLGRAAQSLRRNAEDQRRTSAADGGWTAPGTPGTPGPGAGDPGALGDQAGRSDADQLAWWSSLTPAQQAKLLAEQPAALLAMTGLPAEVRAKANAQVVKGLLPAIATETDAFKIEAGGNIKIVSLGASGEAIITTFADGHVEVSLGGELAAGIGPKGTEDLRAEIRATGKVAGTWTFATQDEANRFLKGLIEAPLPDDAGDVLGGLGVLLPGGGGAGAYAGAEIAEYLQGQSAHYKTTVVGGELSADVKVGFPGVGSIEVHDGMGVEYDTAERTTTAYLTTKAGGSATLTPWAGAISGEDKLAVTWAEDGSIKSMTISGKYAAQTGSGFAGPAQLSSVAGAGGSYEVKLDLTNAANQTLALDLLRGTASGDPAAMSTAYNGLFDSSQIVVSSNLVSTTKVGVDAAVVNAGGSGTTTTAVDTFVKPSHGTFVPARP